MNELHNNHVILRHYLKGPGREFCEQLAKVENTTPERIAYLMAGLTGQQRIAVHCGVVAEKLIQG